MEQLLPPPLRRLPALFKAKCSNLAQDIYHGAQDLPREDHDFFYVLLSRAAIWQPFFMIMQSLTLYLPEGLSYIPSYAFLIIVTLQTWNRSVKMYDYPRIQFLPVECATRFVLFNAYHICYGGYQPASLMTSITCLIVPLFIGLRVSAYVSPSGEGTPAGDAEAWEKLESLFNFAFAPYAKDKEKENRVGRAFCRGLSCVADIVYAYAILLQYHNFLNGMLGGKWLGWPSASRFYLIPFMIFIKSCVFGMYFFLLPPLAFWLFTMVTMTRRLVVRGICWIAEENLKEIIAAIMETAFLHEYFFTGLDTHYKGENGGDTKVFMLCLSVISLVVFHAIKAEYERYRDSKAVIEKAKNKRAAAETFDDSLLEYKWDDTTKCLWKNNSEPVPAPVDEPVATEPSPVVDTDPDLEEFEVINPF
ncbi:unnamed protein product, partial [Mesorhabditis spiculigera]